MEYAFDFEENIDVALLVETLQAGGFKKPYNSIKERGLTDFFMKHEDGAIVNFRIENGKSLKFKLAPRTLGLMVLGFLLGGVVGALLPLKEVGAIFYTIELTVFLFLPKEIWKWRYNKKYDYILSDTYDVIEKM